MIEKRQTKPEPRYQSCMPFYNIKEIATSGVQRTKKLKPVTFSFKDTMDFCGITNHLWKS